MLQGDVNEDSAADIVSLLIYLDKVSKDDIYLYINSPGGVITDGMSIYDTMNYIESDVATLCIGQACSMGAFLLSAGTKGKRASLPNSRIMIHQPLGGAHGQASDIAIQAEEILYLKKSLNEKLSEHTGQTIETIEEDTERDNFMSAKEAKEYGLIDKVIE
jgi:ATP-dependent Clp protease protease subunit